MLEKIYENTKNFINDNCKEKRKKRGQFFTPLSVAEFMASKSACKKNHISILEPGAGNGLLTAALVQYCVDNNLCKSFTIEFIENDPEILSVLSETSELIRQYITTANGLVDITITKKNYITDKKVRAYDVVICNPPYKKVRKDSTESKYMKKYVYGQPNLYYLFMCKAINDIKPDGKFVFITPRSWASGSYYQKARHYILENINLTDLLLFENRNNIFTTENVLQETLITCGIKSKTQNTEIKIYNDTLEYFQIPAAAIKNISDANYLLLPSQKDDLKTINKMAKLTDTFESLGYCFKTGPVVEFRNKGGLSLDKKNGYVPMIRTTNIIDGQYVFPVKVNKAQYIDTTKDNLLLKNMNTVFVRRLSTKEEKRRLQSCVYLKDSNTEYISVENHVNYLVHSDGTTLSEKEAKQIHTLLMSDDYDVYFRMINGNTQVNASEINKLPVKKESLL